MAKVKVFGIGWGRTGTKTLGTCFRILGYDHQSLRLDLMRDVERGDLSRIRSIAEQKDSFEDLPWFILFREMDQMFPGSKFVLTTRDPERWLRSYRNMLRREGPASENTNRWRSFLYNLPFPDVTDQQVIDRYTLHKDQVLEYFADRPDSLLVVDWEKGDGWEKLCPFLGRPIPTKPFPHRNQGDYTGKPVSLFSRFLNKFKPKKSPPYRP